VIFNYSFSPLSDFIRSKGVVDLEDDRIEELSNHLKFEYTPTLQGIRMRCSLIVDHAIANNHFKVYIKNYSTFQSYLVQEFQSRKIKVFVPLYENMAQDEDLMSYYGFNKIAYFNEVGVYELNFSSVIAVEYLSHSDNSFIFKSLKATVGIYFDESFIDEVRTGNIHHLMFSKYNISISNMDEFLSDLSDYFNSELFNTCIDLDTQQISDFLNYCNNKRYKFRSYNLQTAFDFESTLDTYKLIPDNLKTTVDLFLTSKYNKFNIYRNFEAYFNLPLLYRWLGYYLTVVSEYHKSNEYLNRYLDIIDPGLYGEDMIFHPRRNLIRNLIFLSQFKKAEVSALELLENCDELQYQFIYQNLAIIYLHGGREDQAIKIFEELIKIDTMDASKSYYHQLAIIYFKMGEREQAMELLDLAEPKFSKFADTISRHELIYFAINNKLSNLESLRSIKFTDPQIGQQLEFFEILDKFMTDNEYFAEAFSEFLFMQSSVIQYNYICFLILFNYYFKLGKYKMIVEMMDRIESQLRKDELRDNIKLARNYIENENYNELERLFDVSLVNYLI
jgi:tetratricopeptide (TPR) repeat protein